MKCKFCGLEIKRIKGYWVDSRNYVSCGIHRIFHVPERTKNGKLGA